MREVIKCSVGKKGLKTSTRVVTDGTSPRISFSGDVVAEERGKRGCGYSGNIQFREFLLLVEGREVTLREREGWVVSSVCSVQGLK